MREDRTTPRQGARGSEAAPAEVASIPLVEERLSVSKREVESGRLLVHVTVAEREEVVAQELSRDDVEIERVSRNVPISELPRVRLEGSTTIVPVVEEVLVVEKRLMLVEEIYIRRRSEIERHETSVTLKTEHAKIDRQKTLNADQRTGTETESPR